MSRIEDFDRQQFEYEPVAELPSSARRSERPPTAERPGAPSLRPSEDQVPGDSTPDLHT